jgi:hypothetical protein
MRISLSSAALTVKAISPAKAGAANRLMTRLKGMVMGAAPDHDSIEALKVG